MTNVTDQDVTGHSADHPADLLADHHLRGHTEALAGINTVRLHRWGQHLAQILTSGARLLIAGNGGSAAEAQHLSAELLGRYRTDRRPLPAIALHADTSTLTAISNDYGYEQSFARQVTAHGRPGDVLLVLTTSGESTNLLAALAEARNLGLTTWALTGPVPNPTAAACDEFIHVTGSTAHVQECHLVAVHLLCEAIDAALLISAPTDAPTGPGGDRTLKAVAGQVTPPVHRNLVIEPERPTLAAPLALVIVGDALLDETLSGDVHRISPEAPVPVVTRPDRRLSPGGAALAALLAAEDGHVVTLITALSSDDAAATILDRLEAAGVGVINLGTGAPTAVKTRIRSGDQTMLMLDHAHPKATPYALTDMARAALDSASAILVSDYGRGISHHNDLRAHFTDLAPRIPIVWDPHPRGATPVPGTTVVTPNRREAAHFTDDLDVLTGETESLGTDVARARSLLGTWHSQHVALTRGSNGVVLVSSTTSGAPLVIPAPHVPGADACGAGDRFAGDLAAQLATGVLPSIAVAHAVHAAALFVGRAQNRSGTTPPTATQALDPVTRTRAEGGTVVATGGCFDLLHRGHVAMLQQARTLGDCLVVLINSDASVTRLKGHPQPLVPAHDRAAVLQALACVDAVIVFDDDTPEETLARLKPDVFVKGGDYALDDLPERATIENYGGQVVLVPYLDGRSTTSLITLATATS